MRFHLLRDHIEQLDRAANFFERNGFLPVDGSSSISFACQEAAIPSALQPLLVRLLGPLVHVQVEEQSGSLERPQWRQDFFTFEQLTSPSGIAFWLPELRTGADYLRVYPGSHRFGFL